MQPLVSVIMPAYNAGKHITESIQSVISQTYVRWELIVIDDGSTDNTADLVRDYISQEPRVTYISQRNGGQANARNAGLRIAQGSLIAFLDADDLWLPEKLELQVSQQSETGADVVFSDGYIFSESDPATEVDKFAVVPGKTNGAEMFKLLYAFNRIATLSVLVSKSSLDAVGMFDEQREYQNCEDYDLWLRLAKSGATFFGMTEKLVRYRRHSEASTYNASKLLKPMLAVILKHANDNPLEKGMIAKRVQGLYRELISALIDEGRIAEARKRMREFSAWDRGGVITMLQRLLLRLSPRHYNYISRECLYRTQWHAESIAGKLKGA
jgi:glycosyltransferase involved in cell wall biosynthesis